MDLIKRGKLIVIEGTDGTGKATQADLLVKKFESFGQGVKLIDFPQYGKNVFADTVASYLRDEFGKAVLLNPYLASLPYSADRWKASLEFKKDINNGLIVISNRYTSANMGHQGGKIEDKEERKKFIEWLKRIEFSLEGFAIPMPDLTILLTLNEDVSQKLVDMKADREYLQSKEKRRDGHEASLFHLIQSARAFVEIAKEEGWKVIDCTDKEKNWILSPEKIHEMIWEEVRKVI